MNTTIITQIRINSSLFLFVNIINLTYALSLAYDILHMTYCIMLRNILRVLFLTFSHSNLRRNKISEKYCRLSRIYQRDNNAFV